MTQLGWRSEATVHVAPHRVEVREVRTEVEYAAVLDIRHRVFGDEQRIATAVADPDDERGIHALALLPAPDGPRAVGTGRLILNHGQRGEAQIAWVATLPPYRGRGVGRVVMTFLLATADAARAPLVLLSAQTHALPFYLRLGFFPYGDRFTVHGIEHQWMARPHPR